MLVAAHGRRRALPASFVVDVRTWGHPGGGWSPARRATPLRAERRSDGGLGGQHGRDQSGLLAHEGTGHQVPLGAAPRPAGLSAAPSALRLTVLALAARTSLATQHSTGPDALARPCGHSPQQTGELLDRLVTADALTTWHRNRETDESVRQLPQPLHTDPPRSRAPKEPGGVALAYAPDNGRRSRGTTGSACP